MSKSGGIVIGAGGAIVAMVIGAGVFAAYDRMGDDESAVATPTTSTTEAPATTTDVISATSTTEAVASSPDAFRPVDADQLRKQEARDYERGSVFGKWFWLTQPQRETICVRYRSTNVVPQDGIDREAWREHLEREC